MNDIFKGYSYDSIYRIFNMNEFNLRPLIFNSQLCKDNSEQNNENKYLWKCEISEYIIKNNSYRCTKCKEGYYLDSKTNICYKNTKIEMINKCEIENIGNELNPIFSCKKCNNNNYVLVTIESGVKICMEPLGELENCKEANANTTYINTIYNCTKCSLNYLPYNSKFFERKICQNIYGNIIREHEKTLIQLNSTDKAPAKNGICQKNNLFTPDGVNCYSCSNELIGMPGCKGICNFSLKRKNMIKCEEGCKSGYIESSEGICELCENINKGCYECHYENGYPLGYIGIRRKRRFVCDYCEEGYLKTEKGECSLCPDLISNCEKCEIDIENNNEYKCNKCSEGYFVNEEGDCIKCDYNKVQGKNKKCVFCDDINEGGIKGCALCEKNDSQTICQVCKIGYILLKNNNTCIELEKFNGLKELEFCEHLSIDENNKLYCSKCKFHYFLLKQNNVYKCLYVPILFKNYDINNYYNYYYPYYYYWFYDEYYYYYYYYYNYYRILYPCQESINLGTSEKPVYSCTKCYQLNEYEKANDIFTKIINPNNNLSFCFYQNYYQLYNCTEAINRTINGNKKFDCIKCTKNNILMYNEKKDVHYCQFINYTEPKKCMVNYCKTCRPNNIYYCTSCINSNYILNTLTGSCVKKVETVPSVTWKDIFRLELNSGKKINNRYIYGPSLRLRGITNCQINSRHAFLIYHNSFINI